MVKLVDKLCREGGGEGMTEVLPLTLLVIARRGCYCAGQEEGGESSEMHCGRLVDW